MNKLNLTGTKSAGSQLAFLWQPAPEGVRLLRVYGSRTDLVLPDEIHRQPITEIGPYCFAENGPRFTGEAFFCQDPSSEENASLPCRQDSLPDRDDAICGRYLETVRLPLPTRTLHNAAFYNCRNLRRITAGPHINGIGSDEFTNDTRLRTLEILADWASFTGLPLFTDRLTGDLRVLFREKNRGRIQAALYFPEYYEWLDEITPAHIFSRSVNGEGFRMRKSFSGRLLDLAKYDQCFAAACKEESDRNICEIALNRLMWPVRLGGNAKQDYEEALKNRLEAALKDTLKKRDGERLSFLLREFGSADRAVLLEDTLALAAESDWGEGAAILMEARRKYTVKKTFDLDW